MHSSKHSVKHSGKHSGKHSSKRPHTSVSHKSHTSSERDRTFTINNAYHVDGCPTKFSHNDYSGRYISKSASRAVSKALTHLCAVKRIHGQCTLYIELRETTQGSKHKLYAYHCKRILLQTPVTLNGRTFKYKSKIKSVSIPTEKCAKSHKSHGRIIGFHSKLKKLSNKSRTKSKSKSKSKSMFMSMSKSISNSISKIMPKSKSKSKSKKNK